MMTTEELKFNGTFGTPAKEEDLAKAAMALNKNGFCATIVENGEAARHEALELIPPDSEVMDMTSITLKQIKLDKDINESGRYVSLRNKLSSMDDKEQGDEKRKIGAVPQWAVGSVHAVTLEGQVMVASFSGSQLPAYVYGAGHVLWIVGAQKVVKDLNEGWKRVKEYTYPLEDLRAMETYKIHSGINKLLIMNKETVPSRVIILLVKEKLGF